eukprot:scaffold50685_cov70-Phaeocystis_antarctica.AAC.1
MPPYPVTSARDANESEEESGNIALHVIYPPPEIRPKPKPFSKTRTYQIVCLSVCLSVFRKSRTKSPPTQCRQTRSLPLPTHEPHYHAGPRVRLDVLHAEQPVLSPRHHHRAAAAHHGREQRQLGSGAAGGRTGGHDHRLGGERGRA